MDISKKQEEFEVVYRLRILLGRVKRNIDYDVTMSYALFTGIIMWSRQSLGRFNENKWPELALRLLHEKAIESPWKVNQDQLDGEGLITEFLDQKARKIKLKDATIWQLIVFIRNCIGHGDGRTVKPKSKPNSPRGSVLEGFTFSSNKTDGTVYLTKDDMIQIADHLAQVLCDTYSLSSDQIDDAHKWIKEAALTPRPQQPAHSLMPSEMS
jgi:hypothetical protein